MDAGKLRHRVVLQTQVDEPDSNGNLTTNWTDVATLWSEIAPLSARDFLAADAEQTKINTRITIRYRAGIVPKMRFYHLAKDIIYTIEGILPDADSGLEYITFPCSEGVRV